VLASTVKAIEKELLADFTSEFHPFFNAHPGGEYPVIFDHSPTTIMRARWGLVPYWSKWKSNPYMSNAFVSELVKHPAYRMPIRKRRCLVPVNCYYAWIRKDGKKQPHVIYLKDQRIFTLAGIYDEWCDRSGDLHKVVSFAIITNYSNKRLSKFSQTMPVIIPPSRRMRYLKNDIPLNQVMRMVRTFESDLFNLYPVSMEINHQGVDHKGLVQPIGEAICGIYL
jgi:putative SOS response-associated peptidase YedK